VQAILWKSYTENFEILRKVCTCHMKNSRINKRQRTKKRVTWKFLDKQQNTFIEWKKWKVNLSDFALEQQILQQTHDFVISTYDKVRIENVN